MDSVGYGRSRFKNHGLEAQRFCLPWFDARPACGAGVVDVQGVAQRAESRSDWADCNDRLSDDTGLYLSPCLRQLVDGGSVDWNHVLRIDRSR